MLKAAGGILAFAGCALLGYWYRQRFQERIRHIRRLEGILEMLMSEVRFAKAPLPECCEKLGKRLESPYREAFEAAGRAGEKKEGEAFGDCLEKKLQECLPQTPLGREEKEIFLRLVREWGYEDGRMQLKNMEQNLEMLQAVRKRLEREVEEKGRMAMGLGVMGGLLLTILFV